MNATFQLTPQATEDLDTIWWFIAGGNREAADRVEVEIVATCKRLAKHPLMGTKRQDITLLPLRFWTLPKYPNYVIVYRPDTAQLQVVAVLAGQSRPERSPRKTPFMKSVRCRVLAYQRRSATLNSSLSILQPKHMHRLSSHRRLRRTGFHCSQVLMDALLADRSRQKPRPPYS